MEGKGVHDDKKIRSTVEGKGVNNEVGRSGGKRSP